MMPRGLRTSALRVLDDVPIAVAVSLWAIMVCGSVVTFGRQRSTPSPPSAFDVASVKPSRLPPGNLTWDSRTFIAPGITVEQIISYAYQVPSSQVLGGPGWMRSERFEIRAKAPQADSGPADETRPSDPPLPLIPGMAPGMPQMLAGLLPMLRSLLAERFALRVRDEARLAPIYVVYPKGGPGSPRRMWPPDPLCEERWAALQRGETRPPATNPSDTCGVMFTMTQGVMRISARSTSMSMLTIVLRGLLGRPVLDRSGVSGNFAFEMTVGRDRIPAFASLSIEPPQGPGGPSISEALSDQLNLLLKGETGPVQFLVVEHVERPTPD